MNKTEEAIYSATAFISHRPYKTNLGKAILIYIKQNKGGTFKNV